MAEMCSFVAFFLCGENLYEYHVLVRTVQYVQYSTTTVCIIGSRVMCTSSVPLFSSSLHVCIRKIVVMGCPVFLFN
jgi:hypothetical protein